MDDDETPHVDASAEDRETRPISNKKWYILGAVFAVVIVVAVVLGVTLSKDDDDSSPTTSTTKPKSALNATTTSTTPTAAPSATTVFPTNTAIETTIETTQVSYVVTIPQDNNTEFSSQLMAAINLLAADVGDDIISGDGRRRLTLLSVVLPSRIVSVTVIGKHYKLRQVSNTRCLASKKVSSLAFFVLSSFPNAPISLFVMMSCVTRC